MQFYISHESVISASKSRIFGILMVQMYACNIGGRKNTRERATKRRKKNSLFSNNSSFNAYTSSRTVEAVAVT